MFIRSRIIKFALSGLVLLAGSAWAASPTVQGDVKGPDGKPLSGAEVQVERKDVKGPVVTVKTNQRGQYMVKDLTLGSYVIRVSAPGMASTAATNVKPKSEGAVRINFLLQVQAGNAQSGKTVKKKAKHMVWMPAQTGSNIGGRWVEVDENGNANDAGNERLEKKSGAMVGAIQSNSGVYKANGN